MHRRESGMKDLVVIGGGPGGYVAAIRASQLGMNVLLVEKDALGGTCLNRGCIPTKAYYQNASVLRTLARLRDFNAAAENITFDMAGAHNRKNQIVSGLVSGIEKLLEANRVEVVTGEAVIAGHGCVMVNGKEMKAKRILIATGSCSAKPPIPGVELPGVITSDQMLELIAVPPRLAIIGGGVIGLEFACIFHSFGSQVTVFEFQPDILGNMDREIVKRMGVFLKKQKIKVLTGTEVQGIQETADGLSVTGKGNKGELSCTVDQVLIATGRRPCTQGIDLEKLGIACNNGFITVNENFETSVPGVYAIGDVIGGPMLAHLASAEGIAAVERMAGLKSFVDYEAVPSCIFTFPEIAAVGLTEEEMEDRGIDSKIGRFPFIANGKAAAMGERDGLVKVIADADHIIRGVHIVGPHASDLIQEAAVIVRNRMKLDDVIATIHPHPTLGEALYEAVLDAAGRAVHLVSRS
jgi:dihydrolipoamide dehydrogenase